jgi:hypothetical protein
VELGKGASIMTRARNYFILAVKILAVWGIFMYYRAYVIAFYSSMDTKFNDLMMSANSYFAPFLLLTLLAREIMGHPLKSCKRPMKSLFVALGIIHGSLLFFMPSWLGNPFLMMLVYSISIMSPPSYVKACFKTPI